MGGKTLRELAFGKPEVKIGDIVVRPAEPGWNVIVPQLQSDMVTVRDGVAQLLDESKPNGGNSDTPGDSLKRLEDTVGGMASQLQQLIDSAGAAS